MIRCHARVFYFLKGAQPSSPDPPADKHLGCAKRSYVSCRARCADALKVYESCVSLCSRGPEMLINSTFQPGSCMLVQRERVEAGKRRDYVRCRRRGRGGGSALADIEARAPRTNDRRKGHCCNAAAPVSRDSSSTTASFAVSEESSSARTSEK